MARYKLVVLSHPVEGREDEYNDWYQNTHLSDVVAVDGFKSAQRYRCETQIAGDDPFPYLAIYEIETDDPMGAIADLKSRTGTDRMTMTDAMAPRIYAALYSEFGELVARA